MDALEIKMPVISCDNSFSCAPDFSPEILACNGLPMNSFSDAQSSVAAAVAARNAMSQAQSRTNYSETVEVPSSEHVAEIVGRQGCKIKALRTKTNTYIKTPVREQEPVFVITGKKDDVQLAKDEILNAAKHFTNIRANRRKGSSSRVQNVPGQVTIQVPVPIQMVGLLVGTKGATIMRIQQQSTTDITTPSKDKEPIFEVTGSKENVQLARFLMYQHIQHRTGQDIMNGNLYDVNYNDNETSLDLCKSLSVLPQMPYGSYTSLKDSPSSSTNFWSEATSPNHLDMSSLNCALLDIDPSNASLDLAFNMRNNDLGYRSRSSLGCGGPFGGSLTSSSLDTLDSMTSNSAHSSPTTNSPWAFGLK